MEYTYIDRIKQIKSEKKITNDRLSEMTDIPLGTLSKILAGISDSPKLSNIVAICAALECSVDYILTGIPENTNNYTLDDKEIKLTQTEFNIMAFLSEHFGKVLTYSAIIKEIWGMSDSGSIKKLQVNMANIRKKLNLKPGENKYISNELGVGYRMVEGTKPE